MRTRNPFSRQAFRRVAFSVLAGALVAATFGGVPVAAKTKRAGTASTSTASTSPVPTSLPGSVGLIRVSTASSPARTVVRDDKGTLAVLTTGARSVALRGPARTFTEPGLTPTVSHPTWVRELTKPFAGTVDWTWLSSALADRSPDVLAVGTQYLTSAASQFSATGLRYAGDASYGPLTATGGRAEGSDFNDYLGVSWSYPTGADAAEADQIGALDCSGYVRMVFGYRAGLPLTLDPDGVGLPRRSFEILASGPGVVLRADTGVRPALPANLTPGDLVFFDASTDDGTRIDHVGIYLGVDSVGAPRFLSSRKTVDGPTFADVGGRSTLSGTGLYATTFRAVRRL